MSKKNSMPALLVGCLALSCAGRSGSSSSGGGAASSAVSSLKGAIKSVTGSQVEMNQWVLALVERDSGISHISRVNAAGNYTIEGIDNSLAYTMVLLDPQFRVSAVLTHKGLNEGKVRQYFSLGEERLPTLVHNGPVINFTDFASINWTKEEATDSDGNLIPDALETSLRLADPIDSDQDLIINTKDSDIDGDGLPNVFDPDDDADGKLDTFDADADGDENPDITQTTGDQYFNRVLEYFAVQLIQDANQDGGLTSTLMMTAKQEAGLAIASMQIRSSDALFVGAKSIQINPQNGDTTESDWDLSMTDSGTDEDGEKGDGTFARRIKLAAGLVPKAKQVVFVEVVQGEGSDRVIDAFPFSFPNLVTGVISGTYTANTRTINLTGTPFGGETGFHWTVHVYDAAGIKVFASEQIEGTVGSYVLPAGATDPGESYSARLVATAIDRIPSFPSWVIRSRSFSLQ